MSWIMCDGTAAPRGPNDTDEKEYVNIKRREVGAETGGGGVSRGRCSTLI